MRAIFDDSVFEDADLFDFYPYVVTGLQKSGMGLHGKTHARGSASSDNVARL